MMLIARLPYFIASISLLLFTVSVKSQITKADDYNPEKLFSESKDMEEKSQMALLKATLFHQEGTIFLDSARYFSLILKNYPSEQNFNLYMKQLETNYTLAYKYIAMADSMAILAGNYKEMSVLKAKEAYAMMGKDVDITYNSEKVNTQTNNNAFSTNNYIASNETKVIHTTQPTLKTKNLNEKVNNNVTPINNNSTTQVNKAETEPFKTEYNYELYVIQLGAGNMNMSYFSKVPEIKTVECKDGVKRYVLPLPYTKMEANIKKEDLMKLGYEQIFVRTKESLDKIAY